MDRFFWVTIVIAAAIWFAMLGHRDLIDPEEGRYAQIPAAMVDSGDWLTPRMNDFKYFEKPALQYWMTAISYTIFGQSNTSARLWTALIGFCCVLFAGYLGRALFGEEAGHFALLFSMSSLLIITMAHLLNLDMALSFFVFFGMGCLAIAQSHRHDGRKCRNWMLAGWAALACATLTKGLIGVVLPAGGVLFYSLWQRDWDIWKNLHLVKGLSLYFLITAPWFIAVSLANEEFAQFFFINEHWTRYTSPSHNREGPLYYFIPVLMIGLMPWLVTSLRTLARPSLNWRPGSGGTFDAERLLWTFIMTTLVFFSLGRCKLPPYILPVIPACAVLCGRWIAGGGSARPDRWSMAMFGIVMLVAGVFATRFASIRNPEILYESYRPWMLAGGVSMLVAAVSLHWIRGAPRKAVAVASLASLLAVQMLLWGYQSLAESRSNRKIAESIQALTPVPDAIYTIETIAESLPFYLGRPVTLVGQKGELAMGIDAEPQKWIETVEEFKRQWVGLENGVAVIDNRWHDKYAQMNIPMVVVYQGPRRMVVTRK